MADEAKLIVELVDRSPGAPQQAGGTPSAETQVPGSTHAGDFNAAVTQAGGAGRLAAAGNVQPAAAPPVTLPAAVPSAQAADPLLDTIRRIAEADPRVTAEEISRSLGLPPRQAREMLEAVQQPPPTQALPTAAEAPATLPGVSLPSLQPPPPTAPVAVPEPSAAAPTTAAPVPIPAAPEAVVRPRGDDARFTLITHPDEELLLPEAPEPPIPSPAPPPEPPSIGDIEDAAGIIESLPPADAAERAAEATREAERQLAKTFGAVQTISSIAAGRVAPGAAAVELTSLAGGAAAAAPVAAGLAAAAVPIAAVAAVDALASRAIGEVRDLSPAVAIAEAQAEVRQLITRLSTARTLGDELADIVESRSRLSAASTGIRDVLAEPALQEFAQALRGVTGIVERFSSLIDSSDQLRELLQDGVKQAIDNTLATFGLKHGADLLRLFGRFDPGADESPFHLFLNQPEYQHLPLPAPFADAGQVPIPALTEFNAVPGLDLSAF